MTDHPARVRLVRLRLAKFRNYESLDLAIEPRSAVFVGDNGAGKTNLLEAISMLSPGRGLRRAAYDEIVRAGAQDGFAVHAVLEGPFGAVEIGTGTAGSAPGESGRRIRINGAPAKSADALLEWARVVWLTPSMDTLFTGPAAERRRFLDRLVLTIDPGHGQRALDYEKAMRSRNRLLAEASRDQAWFSAIEAQMAETGVAIAAARVELIRLLSAMIARMPAEGPFPQADTTLVGSLEEAIASSPASDVEEKFRERLAAERFRDQAAGRTLEGPHRSDLLVRHRPKAMEAQYCSTGEQKALLIGLVLSHARLSGDVSGQVPLVLLDEIAAHLDQQRRTALFDILEEIGCQAFMTGTEIGLFSSLTGRAQFFDVARGQVTLHAG
ncbi:DNA replication/repair protein RecF [Pseudaminobacter sp. 19-2017]|uniref:DNA replication and repair protein RecF n=1 Tax=Pseudaminobacter soli (ex Zhang et al. 2022) TaxID=2831468 RepID=A0A942I491_9HYPH|nr:DNA replication/repair protein RecF [Pseudaminobacter soli]MBS3651109.1 DNA replication/repair protein RecF [Pseudaminobacter soli]